MATFGDMINRIARDLDRDDLATQINEAILSAIKYYRHRPVVQGQGTLTPITTVVDQRNYTLPSDFISPIQFTITDEDSVYPMTPRTIQWIDEMDNNAVDPVDGVPQCYAIYGATNMVVWPVADAATYEINGRYVAAPAPPEDDADEGFWMEEAERAIRCRAMALLYDDTIHDPELADREYAKSENEWMEIVRHLEMRAYAPGIRAHG